MSPLAAPVDTIQQYKFKQVAILSLAYAVTFGSELAVDIGSCPSGGWISDKFGRKKSLVILLIGAAIGFLVMSIINSACWR